MTNAERMELLALEIADGKSYHIFNHKGLYIGRSFYYPGSASAFLQIRAETGNSVKYLTNLFATQERKWG